MTSAPKSTFAKHDEHLHLAHVKQAQHAISPLDLDQLEQYWTSAWQKLCVTIERSPEPAQPALVDAYIAQVLQWPSYARYETQWLTEEDILNRSRKLHLFGQLHVNANPSPVQRLALEHPEALPHVRRLSIRQRIEPQHLALILSSPLMSQITELAIDCRKLTPAHLEVLIASPHREQLTTLILERSELGPDGAKLLGSRPWPSLTYLDLNKGLIGNGGLEALCASGQFTALRSLRLAENKLTAKAIQALKPLEQLWLLDLSFNQGKAAMAKAIGQSEALATLEHLGLGANEISDGGLSALAKSPHLGALRSLSIPDNFAPPLITDQGILALAQSQQLQKLEHLNLSYSELTWQGMAALLSSPHMSKLRGLIAAHCSQLDLSTADALTTIEPIAPLESLDLSACPQSNPKAAAKLLPKLKLPKTLTALSLFHVELNLDMLKSLGQHPDLLHTLRTLNLYGTTTKAAHIEALAKLDMPALRALTVGGLDQHATPATIARLVQAPWFSQLHDLNITVTESGSDALRPHLEQHEIMCWD